MSVLAGVALFGIEPWLQFAETLREPLERTFTANIGFSGLLGPVGVAVGVVVAVAIFVVGVLTGGARGYGLSIIAGIVAGPYTFIHYLAGTIVAAEPVLRARPRRLARLPEPAPRDSPRAAVARRAGRRHRGFGSIAEEAWKRSASAPPPLRRSGTAARQ